MNLHIAVLNCDGGCGTAIEEEPTTRSWISGAQNYREAAALGWVSRYTDKENRHPIWLCPKCAKTFAAPVESPKALAQGCLPDRRSVPFDGGGL
jgi:hypothetical protein